MSMVKGQRSRVAPKVLCIIQARMGSTRLPGKILKEVLGAPLLEHEIRRVRRAKKIDRIVVATTTDKKDAATEALCTKLEVDCFRGSEDDVLDRYFRCAFQYPAYNTIVRITGDCPLIDPKLIDKTIEYFMANDFDYVQNVPLKGDTYPEGMDVEVFTREALFRSAKEATLKSEREHVTLYIRNNDSFRKGDFPFEGTRDLSNYRLTVDNPDDFEVVSFLMNNTAPDAGYMEYVALLNAHPEIMGKNRHIERNEGLKKSLAGDATAS